MVASRGRGNAALAARSAWIGSALEYYDFFLYGTAAALVFGRVFFPEGDAAVGTLVALATFGVGYAASRCAAGRATPALAFARLQPPISRFTSGAVLR
ncbi:hypothetical protein [Actinoplanes awajinensis]|uniref:hypothetical protein n=1 Tax=Actinoplanes awajinensis TaxID=135946 RepID=UPI0018DE8A36|nr:hypothetical protein [Actinoplanes awajinensis]